jgi:hypothetical protein
LQPGGGLGQQGDVPRLPRGELLHPYVCFGSHVPT